MTEPTVFVDNLDKAELRVSGVTNPKTLAGSIVSHMQEGKTVCLAAIGHQAIGQAVKSVPIVNSYIAAHGYVVAMFPAFEVKHIAVEGSDDLERTACILHLVRIRPR
jgi:stage V sporulation protein S